MADFIHGSNKNHLNKSSSSHSNHGTHHTSDSEQSDYFQLPEAIEQIDSGMMMRLQRTYGNYQTNRILSNHYSKQDTPTIQRMIMTDKQFESSIKGLSFRRSAQMLAIQNALIIYNKATKDPLDERINKLDNILSAALEWKRAKDDSEKAQRGKEPRNMAAVKALISKALQEKEVLRKQQKSAPDLTKPEGVRTSLSKLFDAAAKETRSALAIDTGSMGNIGERLAAYKQKAIDIKDSTDVDDTTAEGWNAIHFAETVELGIEILNLIASAYVAKDKRAVANINRNQEKLLKLVTSFEIGDDQNPGNMEAFLEAHMKMSDRIADFMSIVVDRVKGKKSDDTDTDVVDSTLGLLGEGSNLGGLYGTTGASNSGVTKKGFESSLSDNQKNAFSGGFDIGSHATGHVGDTIALAKALNTLKDKDASEEDKRNARFTIAKYPLQLVEHTSAMIGGGWTALKQDGASLPKSNFGFDPKAGSGTDISTDVKLFGDFAGWFSGMIDAIKESVNFVHYLDGSERDIKDDMSSGRKVIERIGNVTSKAAGIGASLTKSYKAAVEIGMQIKDAGQTTTDAVSALAPKELLPAVGIVTGSIGAIQNAYKLWRIGTRRGKLTLKISNATIESELDDIQTLEFAHGTLVKRTVRLGKNLAHSIISIVSSALTLGGVTAPATLAIGIAQAAEKLGAIAFRKAKQYSRDKKAEQRNLKDESRGKKETFQEWKMRKRMDAAVKGKGKQFITSLDVFFTRNWDKSSVAKTHDTRDAALHILDMNDDDVFAALGVTKAVKKPGITYKEKLDIVITALNKRD